MSLFQKYKNLVDYDGTWFYLLGFSDEFVEKIDWLGGIKRPTKKEPYWRIPSLPFHVQELSKLRLRWTNKAAEQGRYLITEANNRLKLSKAIEPMHLQHDFDDFGLTLHPYQKTGVEYMARARRVLLADEIGLGKTAQVLAFLHKEPIYPVLIICPASLKYWWKQEGERCLPGKRFVVLDSKFKPLEIKLADVCIVNYDLLAAGWESVEKKDVKLTALGEALLEHPFYTIICDEIHACKSYSAQRTKAVKKLAEGKLVRIGITGTPITNRPAELAPILQILNRLNDMGGWMHYMKRYCGSKMNKFNPFGGSHHEKELHDRMRASFYIRRTKKDVNLELPPLTRSIIPVEIDNRAEYEKAENEFIKWVKQKAEEDTKFRESIAHLPEDTQRQLIEEYKHDKAQRAKKVEAMMKIGVLKRIAGQGKLKALTSWVNNFLESDEKLLLFATHKPVIEGLKKSYPEALAITSDMSAEARQETVIKFQNNGCNLLIGAMGTSAGSSPAGTGLTLTAASNLVFTELGWTSAHHNQMEGRCYRIGQSKPVTSYYIIGKDTIESTILTIIDSKREICNKVTDGVESDSTPPLIDILMETLANC